MRVFYDKDEQAILWGKDLYAHLSNLYQHRARFCVMFLSQHYARKHWTNHERKAAQARAFADTREYILPIRLDDTPIPGVLETVGYLDWRATTLDTIVKAVESKLIAVRDEDEGDTPAPTIPKAPTVSLGTPHRTRPPVDSPHLVPEWAAGTAPPTVWRNIAGASRVIVFVLECAAGSLLGGATADWLLGQLSIQQAPVRWATPVLVATGLIWGVAYATERATNAGEPGDATSPYFPLHYVADIFSVHGIPDLARWLFTVPLLNVACSWALAHGAAELAVSHAHATYDNIFYLVFGVATAASLVAFATRYFRAW